MARKTTTLALTPRLVEALSKHVTGLTSAEAAPIVRASERGVRRVLRTLFEEGKLGRYGEYGEANGSTPPVFHYRYVLTQGKKR